MDRLKNFESLAQHPWYGRLWFKLPERERTRCRSLIIASKGMGSTDFSRQVVKMFENEAKPACWTTVQELLDASNCE